MSIKKETAHLVIDKTNSSLVASALHLFQEAVAANTENRLSDAILSLIQSTQYLERLIYTVPDSAYENRYGSEAIRQRRFYNIVAGDAWYHPFWTAIDISLIAPDVGITHDLNDRTPFPIDSNTAKLVYTSHCLEHLNQETMEHALAEALRILEPGGLMRIAVPDIDIFYRAYQRQENDFFININDNSGQYNGLSLQQNFLAQFVYPCCSLSEETKEFHMSDADVDDLFNRLPYEDALDACVDQFPSDLKISDPPHIN